MAMISLSDDRRPNATSTASNNAMGTVSSRNAGKMYEKSCSTWSNGTPRLTTSSTSLRMRAISRINVTIARPNPNGIAISRSR